MITRRRQRAAAPRSQQGVISITRRAAFGDVICSTVIADAVARMGYQVQFNTLPQIVNSGVLNHHRSITCFGPVEAAAHVQLDQTYDNHPERGKRMAMSFFYERAIEHLGRYGIELRPECNLRPQLNVLSVESDRQREKLNMWPRPWVAVVPRSNAWPNRSVPTEIWKEVAAKFPGTMFWTGTDRPGGSHIVDLTCSNMRDVAVLMSVVDLTVGVDTGPMWCAVGVNTPILGINQARAFNILMNDQVDWRGFTPPLDCIGCSQHKCPKNEASPPCRDISPTALLAAINQRLDSVLGNKVTAVIPCLHDEDPRVIRCINAVLPQVDEVVLSIDGNGDGLDIPENPKLRIIHSPRGRKTGFGPTCNRGARQASGRFILFLNDDLYLDPGAVRAMKRTATDERVAITGGLWRYPDGLIQHGGGARYQGDVGFGHRDWKKKTPSITAECEMEFVTAACMMVRREAFYEAGAFGEEFGNYCEDADLCMKVREAGWKVMYQPAATGIHDESQTTKPEKMLMLNVANKVFREKWNRYFAHNVPDRLGVFV